MSGLLGRAAGPTEGWTSFSHWRRNANGTITSDLYAAPVFSAAGGSWHRADLAVKASNGAATAGLVRPVQFGNDTSHLVSLGLDAGPVTISAPDLTIGRPSVSSRSVRYEAVAPSTDLWYLVNPQAIVEDFVLESASSPTSFTFHISDPSHALGSVSVGESGAHFSSLIDGDVRVGLGAPFAYEERPGSNPERDRVPAEDRGSAHMSVTAAGDGWDVTESVDPDWLKGRSYPIVLDPTVTFDHASGTMVAGSDVYVPSGCLGGCTPNTTSSDLAIGTYTDSTYDWEPARAVFRFDLSSIPIGSQISSAALAAYVIGCIGNPSGGTYYCNQHDYTVELHQLDGPWSTSSTYDQIAAVTNAGAFSSLYQPAFTANFNPPCTGCFWENFDVTSKTQDWVNSPSTNYGFVAKTQTEPYSIGGPGWSYLGPQGGGNGWPPPHLSVTYTPNTPSAGETLGGFNPSEPAVMQCVATYYPVNCATGDLYHTFADLSLPGRGIPLSVERTYNSLAAATNGPFGYGWISSYTMSLAVDGSGNVTISQENGSQVAFSPASGGGYTAPPRVSATLVKNTDGTYTFTRRQRDRFTFSSGGQLTAETDLNGYTTTLSYSGSRLTTVTEPGGRTLTFTYGGNGDVASVTDSGGRTVTYGYDASGNLTRVTDVAGGATSFTYDSNHLLLTMTDPRGGTTTNAYDASARVTAQVDPMNRRTTFSYAPSSTTVTDPNGNSEVQNYTDGVLTSFTRGSGTPQAATWTYVHDSPTLAATSVTDPNGHTSRATYDANANLLTQTDALGRTTTYTYDALDDLTSVTDPVGHVSNSTYDATGNLLTQSQAVTETGQTARTTYTYGDSGHPGDVTGITDPTGAVWSYAYDSRGNQTRAVDPLGNTMTFTYDVLGRRTSTVSARGNLTGANPSDFTTSFTYDSFGDLLTSTDALGDKATNVYDANRNLVSVTDPDGHATSYAYDADNELTAVTRADGSVTRYGYDGDGNRTSWTDGNGNATMYGYDPLDRQASTTDPLGRTTTRAYDGVGNLLTVTDPSSQVTTYAYDAADEPVNITYSDAQTPNVSLAYNADGQVTSESSNAVSRTYAYNSLGRLANTTEFDFVPLPGVGGSPGIGRTVGYGYDLASRVTTLSLKLNSFDVNNTFVRNFSRTYNAAGEMIAVSDGLGHTTAFGYDANHNLVSEAYPNSTVANYSYDNADRLTEIKDTTTGGATFLTLPYIRDRSGLLTTDNATGTAVGPPLSYGYDAANRLTSATAQVNGSPSSSYGYDAADNRTSWATPLGTSTYGYDKANELTSASLAVSALGITASTAVSFAYDARGNRTSESDSLQNKITFGYDQANRLVSYSGPAVNALGPGSPFVRQASYGYDASGLRNDLTWDLGEGVPLIVGDLSASAYLTGPDGLPVERIDAAGDAVYYHHDQLGSTRALTGPNGAVLVTYAYDPYGNVTPSNTSVANAFLFAGQYTDASTGLIYLRARWYDPATAAFLSTDPAAATSGELYAYAQDDPTNEADPTGLCSLSTDLYVHPCPTRDRGTSLNRNQTTVARAVYALVRQRGLSRARAIEMIAAAFMESSLNPRATNGIAFGLFQLVSSSYISRANSMGGVYSIRGNTLAIFPAYASYWKSYATAPPGYAAAFGAERSGCNPAWYAYPLSWIGRYIP